MLCCVLHILANAVGHLSYFAQKSYAIPNIAILVDLAVSDDLDLDLRGQYQEHTTHSPVSRVTIFFKVSDEDKLYKKNVRH